MSEKSSKRKRFKSPALEAAHEFARDLYSAGIIDKMTMREFDSACLVTVEPLSPRQIQALRQREGVSQAVFASVLNVRTKLVSEWERGEKKPSGPSLKLLSLVKAKGLDAMT